MRITGGSARGRVLRVPDTGSVRPTSDRMRQQIFNMLEHSQFAADFNMNGAQVMDVFCGSGALGIEALSRGAGGLVFVDMDRRVMDVARANVSLCGFDDRAEFILKSALQIGPLGARAPRDLVLLDAPYRKDLLSGAVLALHNGGWMANGAIIIGESERGWSHKLTDNFVLEDVRAGGDSQLNIWQYRR